MTYERGQCWAPGAVIPPPATQRPKPPPPASGARPQQILEGDEMTQGRIAEAIRDRLDDLGVEGRDQEGNLDGSLWLDGLDAVAEDLAATTLDASYAAARDGLMRYKQALAAENAQWQAEIANLRDLIRRYSDTGMIPVTEISKTLHDGPPARPHGQAIIDAACAWRSGEAGALRALIAAVDDHLAEETTP